MRSFIVFIQKEWMELVRTKKFFILLCVFALFGMLSPVTARYMQEIIIMAMGDTMPLTVAPATWIDSWGQFYSNLSQMGGICLIFLFMGCITGEKQSGSAAMTLTKNLSHTNFVTAKFATATAVFFLSLLPAALICFGYTHFLFGYAGEIINVLLSVVAYAVFMLTLLAITVLTSAISRSTTVGAILAFCGFIILSVSGYVPKIGFVLPGTLLSKTVELSFGTPYSGMIWSLIISLCISALCLYLSVLSLKRQEI